MRRIAALLALSALLLALAGPTALGGLALRLGCDGIALRLLRDDAARGVALYRLGDHAGADRAFARAGRSQTFNRALSLAATGDYALSVAYFDAVLFVNPADAQARAGRAAVAAMVPPQRGDSVAPGRVIGHGGRAADAAEIAAAIAAASADALRRPLEARGMAASDAWLRGLTDDPGAFLRLRILAEYERRAQMGLIRPEAREPW